LFVLKTRIPRSQRSFANVVEKTIDAVNMPMMQFLRKDTQNPYELGSSGSNLEKEETSDLPFHYTV
jgi:hypothetical protein